MRKIWLLQFVANAVIIFAFYEWLGIRDSRVSQLILSAVLGLAIISGAVFLHSVTFHMHHHRFAVILLIFVLLCWGLMLLPLDRWGLWIASTLTFRLRKPIKPDSVTTLLNYLRMFLQWIVIPLVLLQRRHLLFWLSYTGILLAAFFVPTLLIHWTPKFTPTWLQVGSFVFRFGLAYCLVTTGFTALWRLTSAGMPARIQPSPAALQ